MGTRRRNTRQPQDAKELKEEGVKDDCKICGAPQAEQEVSESGSQDSIGRQFAYFQTTTRKSLEMSESVLNRVKLREATLTTQQEDINRSQKELESDEARLKALQKTLEEKESSLEALYTEYTNDQQKREQLLIQREHTVENMMSSSRNKEAHIKTLQENLDSRMQTLELRELDLRKQLESRERSVVEKEERVQNMEKDVLLKQKEMAEYSNRITKREQSVVENEEAFATEKKEWEDTLQAREKNAQYLLDKADEKGRELAALEKDILQREKKFLEREKAAIIELDAREEGLNKREINVGEAQQEVRAKADILEGLKEEFKQREEKFDQWEKMCKYDLAKRKDATTKKETELYQRIETFEVKEKEISVQITEFQKRESDFKLHKDTFLQDIERSKSALTDRETLLKKSEAIVAEREEEVHSKLKDIKQREEVFKKEYSIWKVDIERRERVIINKEKSIERLTESSSEQLAAIKTAEKEIEIRRLQLSKDEAETKKKLKSDRHQIEELSIDLKDLEKRLEAKEKELVDWEKDLGTKDQIMTQRSSEANLDLRRREKEVHALESKWRKIEEECTLKYGLLADREKDLIKREDMFLKNESAHSKEILQRSSLVEEKEVKLSEKERHLSLREVKLEERESYVSKKRTEVIEHEKTVLETIEMRERKLTTKELEVQKEDKCLKDKGESLDLLSEDLLQREREFNAFKSQNTQDVERRSKDIRVKEVDFARRVRELQQQEGDISKVRKELEGRLQQIEHRESMVSGMVERERILEERERAVAVKDLDFQRRQEDLSEREKDVLHMKENFKSQLRDLEVRERKIVNEEERLTLEIQKREAAVHKLEMETRTSRGSFSARESSLKAREEDVAKREAWLLSRGSTIDSQETDVNNRDSKLRTLEKALKEKENSLKLFEKDILTREQNYLRGERLMRTDLEKRERIVKNSELNQASREEEIRSLQRQVQSDKESLELQRTEMISLREKIEERELRIKDLDLQLRKREAEVREAMQQLRDSEGSLVRSAEFICRQRRVSDRILEGADPPLELHESNPLIASEHARAPVKKERMDKMHGSTVTVIERFSAPIDLTPVKMTNRTDRDINKEGDTEVRSWYGRMRSLLGGWKTATPRHVERDDLERSGQQLMTIGDELEQRELFVRARESEMNKRLGEVGYPASSSRKRSSLGTGTDDSLANTPETNATVPLHQMGAGHDSEKTSGRWRRTSGGGLRVLRSSVDGTEGDAGLDRTRVLSVNEATGDWDDWSNRLRKTHKVHTTTYTRTARTTTVSEGKQTETKEVDAQTKPSSEGMVEDSDNQ